MLEDGGVDGATERESIVGRQISPSTILLRFAIAHKQTAEYAAWGDTAPDWGARTGRPSATMTASQQEVRQKRVGARRCTPRSIRPVGDSKDSIDESAHDEQAAGPVPLRDGGRSGCDVRCTNKGERNLPLGTSNFYHYANRDRLRWAVGKSRWNCANTGNDIERSLADVGQLGEEQTCVFDGGSMGRRYGVGRRIGGL
ncbi:hypothetical protein JCM19992_10480 [Thermostilla marina]